LEERPPPNEQPFPDSWIATTASSALGLLTDIASEIVLHRGDEGRHRLWPLVASQFEQWCLGRRSGHEEWHSCEALVRIACKEMHRFANRLVAALPQLQPSERIGWSSTVLSLFGSIVSRNVAIESSTMTDLITSKQHAVRLRRASRDSDLSVEDVAPLKTPFGVGRRIEERIVSYPQANSTTFNVAVEVISLDFGGILYRIVPGTSIETKPTSPKGIPPEVPGEINGTLAMEGGTCEVILTSECSLRCAF
jgi:hypothetical protein